MSSCSLIYDHSGSCDENRTIELRLHSYDDVDSILAAQMPDSEQQDLRNALSAYYKSLLFPSSYNVDLDFYDAATNNLLTSDNVNISGDNSVVTISLPSGNLRCVGQTQQPRYSGNLDMPEGQSSYALHLYPTDANVALVAKVDNSIKDVLVTTSLNNHTDTLNFTREASTATRQTYTGTVQPSTDKWTVTVYATTSTGSITRTVLTIDKPLAPGDLRILQIAIDSNGAATTTAIGVGATVTLDWKKGGEYNPEI